MPVLFGRDTNLGRALARWWAELQDDRASRAALRRSSSITEVIMSTPYQRVYRRLCSEEDGWQGRHDSRWSDRLAAAVGLIAHVEHDDDRTFPEAASGGADGSESIKQAVSPLRFVRLLESPDLDSLFVGLRRLLPLVDRKISVLALSRDVIYWGDEVKKRWAYQYRWPDKERSR